MGAIPVADATWNDEVVRSPLPVLVEMTAGWCEPGAATSRIVDALADDAAGRLKVVRLDLDTNPATIRRYAITSIPTLLVLEHGAVTRRLVGARGRVPLLKDIADYLA